MGYELPAPLLGATPKHANAIQRYECHAECNDVDDPMLNPLQSWGALCGELRLITSRKAEASLRGTTEGRDEHANHLAMPNGD